MHYLFGFKVQDFNAYFENHFEYALKNALKIS